MREELDKKLVEKYPKIFANRYKPMTETCMCWGFECGDGWYNIIDQLCANIQHHINWSAKNNEFDLNYNSMVSKGLAGDTSELKKYYKGYINAEQRIEEMLEKGVIPVRPVVTQVVADQVKEKFGTLRFYYSGGDDAIDGMVRMAESMSGVTCEECGEPGTTEGPGWITTLCEEHRNEKNERYQMQNLQ